LVNEKESSGRFKLAASRADMGIRETLATEESMRRVCLAVALLAVLCLNGCLCTHHEEYNKTAAVGVGPNGVESTSNATYESRDWVSPWPAQADRARP
jgi:hypothetical protein